MSYYQQGNAVYLPGCEPRAVRGKTPPEPVHMPLDEVLISRRRARSLPPSYIRKMEEYLKGYRLYRSVLLDEKNRVLAGEKILAIMKEMQRPEIPAFRIKGLNADEKVACGLAYARLQEITGGNHG